MVTLALASVLAASSASAQEVELTGPVANPPRKPPEEPKLEEVNVRAAPPPRSASDWEADGDVVRAAPRQSGADVLSVAPGAFVTDRGLLGRAPRLSLRGFDGTAGQDVEVFVGNIPMNQVTNLRAPGYADMRLVMPEVVKTVRLRSGPYDPRQGDFAIAGSAHLDLGMESPGYWAKGTLGSFGSRRIFLAYAPRDRGFSDTFAAFEAYSFDGPGHTRGGERASFIGQFAFSEKKTSVRAFIAVGSARFDFPGYLPQADVERGAYPYGSPGPLGRDRAAQTHFAVETTASVGDGTFSLGVFSSKTKMALHQNLTGYVLDAGGLAPPVNSDDAEIVNNGSALGFSTFYRHQFELLSKRDLVTIGVFSRFDTVDQSDTRLMPDGTKNGTPAVDATVEAANIAAYVDGAFYPWKRVVVRGGTRLDSLSYSVKDRTGNQGLERTAQGLHIGNKLTVDYAAGGGAHLLASYGEGFRSPQGRDLREGDRVPFATVQSFEAGVRWKDRRRLQASLVGFQSFLDGDRVFDAATRANLAAPSSSRTGGAGAIDVRAGPFGVSASATYARGVFTAGDARFREGDPIPYAPRLVLRSDTFAQKVVGKIEGSPVTTRFGLGFEGAADRPLPAGSGVGANVFYVDGTASVGWRSLELSVSGMNLLAERYFDTQYVYTSNFQRQAAPPPAARHVLVGPPPSVFVTLQVHLQQAKTHDEDSD